MRISLLMPDVHTPEKRSFNMSRIKGHDTKPERIVRSFVHRLGYRFRLYCKSLPGKPDLVFPGIHKVMFVHGCFFHMHRCRYGSVIPRTNAEFWQNKREANVQRDRRNAVALRKAGWDVLIVWECWTKPTRINRLPTLLDSLLSRRAP